MYVIHAVEYCDRTRIEKSWILKTTKNKKPEKCTVINGYDEDRVNNVRGVIYTCCQLKKSKRTEKT